MKIPKTFRAEEAHSDGSYSLYFKVGVNIGVKLLVGRNRPQDIATLEDVRAEADMIRRAEPSGITPKYYGHRVFTLIDEEEQALSVFGIILEHIQGETLADCNNWKVPEGVEDDLLEKLAKVGIKHTDLHAKNIIRTPTGEYRAIDFTPGHAREIEARRK